MTAETLETSDPLARAVTRDDVIYGYRMFFGRDPESEMAIRHHLSAHANVGAMRDAFIAHSQFRAAATGPRVDSGKWVMAEVFDGCRLWLDLHDVGVSRGCLLGDWEEAETRFVRSVLRPGDTVIDIGANIGWFTLLAASRCGPNGRVHAFEPHPRIARYLRRSVFDSRVDDRVRVHELALDTASGSVTLGSSVNTTNPGHNWLVDDDRRPDAQLECFTVARARLDDILPGVLPRLIKIDIEGAEARALNGAREMLRQGRPTLLCELFPEQLASVSGVSAAAFIHDMAELGFACRRLRLSGPGEEITDFPGDAPAPYVSVVFVPRATSHGTSPSLPGE